MDKELMMIELHLKKIRHIDNLKGFVNLMMRRKRCSVSSILPRRTVFEFIKVYDCFLKMLYSSTDCDHDL